MVVNTMKRCSTNKNSPANRKQALKVTDHVQFCKRKTWGSIFLTSRTRINRSIKQVPRNSPSGLDITQCLYHGDEKQQKNIPKWGSTTLPNWSVQVQLISRCSDVDSTSMEKGALETHP